MKIIILLFAACCLGACNARPEVSYTPTVYLVGDSTMADQPLEKFPEQGWGQALPDFLRDGIKVQNHAANGRSTKSFRDEGLWQLVIERVKPGDFVVIGFGHNDQKIQDPKRYAEAGTDYRANLILFIAEARAKQAEVILVTSIRRRSFDNAGQLEETLGAYPEVVRQVARAEQAALVDLNQLTAVMLEEAGVDASKDLYMHLAPGQYPLQLPEGKQDDTHLQVAGAKKVAGLFVTEVKKQQLALAKWLL